MSETEPEKKRRERSRTINILRAIAPSLLFLVLLELVCQWWEKREPPAVEWPPLPFEIPAKEPQEVRLLFYGGSTVAGLPLPALGFTKQMKYLLEHDVESTGGRYFTLANFGKTAANSTQVVYRMAQMLAESEGDALVVLTAHNEFLSTAELSRDEYARLLAIREQFNRFALIRRAQRYINRYYIARRPEFVEGRNLQTFDRDSQRVRDRIELYRRNIETIVDMARAAGIPLLLCTAPSNTLDWPAARNCSDFAACDSTYAASLMRLQTQLGNGENERAKAESLQLLQERPQDPSAMYYLGKAHYELGQFDEAKHWLGQAKEYDPFPYRALNAFNEIVREQAGRDGVFVVDLERIFASSTPRALPGFDLFADNCHPSPRGNFLIARTLIETLHIAGLTDFTGDLGEAEFNAFLAASGFSGDSPALQIEYFLNNARYAMKPPFFNFEQARQNLEEALKLDENNWIAWANLATVSFFVDEPERGAEQLAQARRLRGRDFDLHDRNAHPLLREALQRSLPEKH